jgi:hypothetical protein
MAHGLTVVTLHCGNVEGHIGLCVGRRCFSLCIGRCNFGGAGSVAISDLGLVEGPFDTESMVVGIEYIEELELLLTRLCPCVLDTVGELPAKYPT